MSNKKEEILAKFRAKGFKDVDLRWVPKNPYGKRHKVTGWVYRTTKQSEWLSLGSNYDDAIKNLVDL